MKKPTPKAPPPLYRVVQDDTLEGLVSDVRSLLATGWQCQGGIVVSRIDQSGPGSHNDIHVLYSQAMIKSP
jgi:hypothetical protein